MIERIPDIRLGPDINWLRRAGIEPNDFLRRYSDRILYLHLRDQLGDRWVEALGEGDQDWVELCRTMVEIDYTATVAADLPNGWKAGQQLAFTGASYFKIPHRKTETAAKFSVFLNRL